ncbi:MAG: type 1 glutamine amidotransferase [Desulfobacterales bacterium]|jgi:GMP synthase-like glutamine amidotransferase|nr:type 1 glutamine amidotransferase [Desulfobacterales bacterium]
MNRILFLDNSLHNDTYRPLIYWEPLLLFPYDLFRVSAGELPHELDSYSHILITGSAASVLDDTEWMQAEVDLIRKAVNNGKVILGSCFGHQIIARSLFGMDAVRKREKPEIGWPDIQIVSSDPLFGESGRTIHTFIFHYDEVCTVPEKKATIIARSKQCDILAFKVKDRPVWGVQPHFEMGIVQGLRYIDKVKGSQVPDRQSFFSSAQYMPKDSGWVIPLMKRFHETHPV